MKSKNSINYLNRIESVQKWINDNPGVHINEMLDEFRETPRGTLSALLSLMLRAGHVIRGARGYYSLPKLIASAKAVALDIEKQKRAPNLFNHAKKRRAVLLPKNAPIEIQAVTNRNQPEPVDEITAAIELLKTHGYRILKSKTEYFVV